MKRFFQILIVCLSVFGFFSSSFAASGEKSGVNVNNFVTEAMGSKGVSITQLFDKSQSQKDIDQVQGIIQDFKIKKELDEKFLSEIQGDIALIQKKIEENQGTLTTLSGAKDGDMALTAKYEQLQKDNEDLKKQIFFKESLISDLKNSIDSYKLLEVKYENVLNQYVQTEKEKQAQIMSENNQKYIILFFGILAFIGLYYLKFFLRKKDIIKKNRDNFYAYYDLIYAIVLIIFTITYLFYLFPQLYILLVFVSGSIIWANAILISSFVSSLIIFRKFAIGDIIGMGSDTGKIVKITPLHTIIRKINEHGIVDGDEMSIPNINLIKDSVNVINDIHQKDHYFSVILSLKDNEELFQIVDEIKKDILLKYLTHRPHSINPFDEDIYKTKYEYVDAENIKVTFYWVGTDELNRDIEKKIISYVKGVLFDSLEKKQILSKIGFD